MICQKNLSKCLLKKNREINKKNCRQFLFRHKDIGSSKAEVAANFVNSRIPGCNVIPHCCKIQDKDEEFYRQFHIVICGLDSIVARRWINGMLLSLLVYENGELDRSTVIPMIDGGTEGFKGNARVILPGLSACVECTLDLYPPQVCILKIFFYIEQINITLLSTTIMLKYR